VEQLQNGSNGPIIVRRRKLIALLGGTALAWPLELRAQEPGRTYRIGVLLQNPRDAPPFIALYDELSRLGFVEGQNLQVDWQGHGLRPEQFAQHAVELVKAKVDVILAGGDAAIRAAQ
jgi:putative tryptophan/tyrosine transport system substrate-binding protein